MRFGKSDMSAASKQYRAARLATPWLPLPAILGFAVAGFGGALFLAYSNFSSAETKPSLPVPNEVPVYEARAVPLDPRPENIFERSISIARALTATVSGAPRAEASEDSEKVQPSGPTLLADANGILRGFSRFSNIGIANSYLALTGTTFGMSAQMSPSGFVAPDAETIVSSPVPEASTWLCGAALLALVAVRGVHASWHRHQRRGASKSNSVRS
jgi:hypothetical protein